MKSHLSFFIVLLIFSIFCTGCSKDSDSPVEPPQPGWIKIDLGGSIGGLFDVHFLNENLGYVVTGNGSIFKTVNGGLNWTRQASPTSECLYGVFAVDQDNAYAVGWGGTILKTTNGGSYWRDIGWTHTSLLSEVCFTDQNYGYIVGHDGYLVMTTNGFATWPITRVIGGSDVLWQSVCFSDALTGYMVGKADKDNDADRTDYIWKTTDRGYSWLPYDPGNYEYRDVCFPSNNVGFLATTHGVLLKSLDGGSHWNSVPLPAGTYDFETLDFPTENVGYVNGYNGNILKTKDGGSTWTTQESGDANRIHSICFVNETTGFAVGYYFFKTTTGGE